MRKTLLFITICFVALGSSNCKKKIKKHPFDMEGTWYAGTGCPGGAYITINSSGKGSFTANYCSVSVEIEGAVKYDKRYLYIHKRGFSLKYGFYSPHEFKFSRTPGSSDVDSISVPDKSHLIHSTRYKVLGQMNLSDENDAGRHTYVFYKIKDY